jgi:hypothetical protein
MSNTNLIGLGIILGSLITGTILICFFGNDKEVLCICPAILLGMYLYTKKLNEDEIF